MEGSTVSSSVPEVLSHWIQDMFSPVTPEGGDVSCTLEVLDPLECCLSCHAGALTAVVCYRPKVPQGTKDCLSCSLCRCNHCESLGAHVTTSVPPSDWDEELEKL
jgi:hypothetical protein